MPKITSYKVTGSLDLKDLGSLLENEYEFLDISEAEMGVDEEQWEVCPLFAFEGEELMNKKNSKSVFGSKAYTVTGEIHGTWDTYEATVEYS